MILKKRKTRSGSSSGAAGRLAPVCGNGTNVLADWLWTGVRWGGRGSVRRSRFTRQAGPGDAGGMGNRGAVSDVPCLGTACHGVGRNPLVSPCGFIGGMVADRGNADLFRQPVRAGAVRESLARSRDACGRIASARRLGGPGMRCFEEVRRPQTRTQHVLFLGQNQARFCRFRHARRPATSERALQC